MFFYVFSFFFGSIFFILQVGFLKEFVVGRGDEKSPTNPKRLNLLVFCALLKLATLWGLWVVLPRVCSASFLLGALAGLVFVSFMLFKKRPIASQP